MRANPRRLRVHQGLSGGEVLPRRQAVHHRRGDERDSAAGDCAAAAWQKLSAAFSSVRVRQVGRQAKLTKCGIERPDKRQLLFAAPVFDLFFPADGGTHVREGFKIDESSDVVGCGESRVKLGFVLGYAAFEEIGYAGVEDARSACQDIDMVNSHRWLVWQDRI